MISMVLLLFELTKCGLITLSCTKPWMSKVVELNFGRGHDANSLALMHLAFGQLCFAQSIESMMAVTVVGAAEDAANLLSERKCQ